MGLPWNIEQVETCPSTNVELIRRAKAGEVQPPFALIALQQTAGQGRNGRTWVTPARGAITMSALVNPHVPTEKLGLFPLFAALAVTRALRAAGFPAVAKWPNDVLLPAATPIEGFGLYRKVGGILCQAVPNVGIVVGIGLNVSQTADELPVPTATSLALYGPVPDSGALRMAILTELSGVIDEWEKFGDQALRHEFSEVCITIGQTVSVHQDLHDVDDAAHEARRLSLSTDPADGSSAAANQLTGVSQGVADDGGLIIQTADGEQITVHAGDVWLRATD